ncbi:MAG TPA: Gfo/Idh/MocA family oxidoreductase [Solirubrobacteraceae bacterium]|nr:Gfo/Idh/MocA family oxidoreductase [Solirubrobacteraceae bacterium]
MADHRVAVAGYGLAGRVFHAPLVAAAPGLTLTHVVTTSAERAAAARSEHPGVRVVDRVELLWGEIDLLVVAAPSDVHVPLAEAAIDRGVAVVVDKPLALELRSAARLWARAAEANVLLSVFHNRRWDSDTLTLARLLHEGVLGDVHRFESRFERWRPDAPAEAWRAAEPARGGGLLLDLGTHLVDQALWLFGPVTSVCAEVATRRPGHVGEDDAFLALAHASGVISHLWVSAVAAAPGPRLRVLGSAGAFTVAGLDGQEADLRAGRRPGDGAPWGEVAPADWGRLSRGDEVAPEPVAAQPGDWPAFYAAMARALDGVGPVPVDPADAVTVAGVLEAARLSAAEGQRVSVDPRP